MGRQTAKTAVANAKSQRRSHQKSRRGCANCKLRRVRCGEEKPECQKCVSYGVLCSYGKDDSSNVGLKFAGEGEFDVQRQQKLRTMPVTSSNAMILAAINCHSGPMSSVPRTDSVASVGGRSWTMSMKELKLFADFQERTVRTLGSRVGSDLYRNEVIRLTSGHPFLQHIVLAVTLFHERHLQGSAKISQETALHWYEGTAKFKETLMKPIKEHEKDALWATAALLGAIQFAAIEASTPEEAWPLRDQENDLDWLKMSDGKKAVWAIADPTRPFSVFRGLVGEHYMMMPRPLSVVGSHMMNISREFSEVFGLGPTSTVTTNPYHGAAFALARLLDIECDGYTMLEFLTVISHVNPALQGLLAQKEPKALLLLACWFAKVYRYQWWIYRRGLLTGTAICVYLDRHHKGDLAARRLLEFPKTVFGLSFASNEPERQPVATTVGSNWL